MLTSKKLSVKKRQELNRYLKLPDSEFMTLPEVSEYLRVPVATLRVWVSQGSINHIKPFKRILFRRTEVIDFINGKIEQSRTRPATDFDYIEHQCKKIFVLPRVEGSSETEKCVFCQKKHNHSPGEGPRATHCSSPRRSTYDRAIHLDGTVVHRSHGYYIKTIKK
jgi:excisionase family DNA binding protein